MIVPCPGVCGDRVMIDTEKDIGPKSGLPSCYKCGAVVKPEIKFAPGSNAFTSFLEEATKTAEKIVAGLPPMSFGSGGATRRKP